MQLLSKTSWNFKKLQVLVITYSWFINEKILYHV